MIELCDDTGKVFVCDILLLYKALFLCSYVFYRRVFKACIVLNAFL